MKKTAVFGITSLVIIAALVLVIGFGSSWFTNWNLNTWFGQNAAKNEVITADNADNYDLAFVEGENNGIKLTSAKIPRAAYQANNISADAHLAYTVTATIYPLASENKQVDWELVWADDNTPVTTCVSMDIPSDGSTSVTLICTESFAGRTMKLICTARDSGVSAFVTVRFEGRASDITVNGNTEISNCRWGQTNTYTIELSNAINCVGDSEYANLKVASVKLYGTVYHYDTVYVNKYESNGESLYSNDWSYTNGQTSYELAEKYPDCISTSINDSHELKIIMSAYPSVSYGNCSTGSPAPIGGGYGTLYNDVWTLPENAYAEITISTGNISKTFRVDFVVSVTGVSLGSEVVF